MPSLHASLSAASSPGSIFHHGKHLRHLIFPPLYTGGWILPGWLSSPMPAFANPRLLWKMEERVPGGDRITT